MRFMAAVKMGASQAIDASSAWIPRIWGAHAGNAVSLPPPSSVAHASLCVNVHEHTYIQHLGCTVSAFQGWQDSVPRLAPLICARPKHT